MAAEQIYDNHGRPISYLRIAVTDRCNLRCFYCMPEEGIKYLPRKELLTYEELERLVKILVNMGVSKVRITGGEPFVRQDLMKFLWKLRAIDGLKDIAITTNGVLTKPYITELRELGVSSINLSLDTIDRDQFKLITRRDEFDAVMETFDLIVEHGIPLKVNAVIMDGKNTKDILPMTALTQHYPVSIRFIEEMPFNGEGAKYQRLTWTFTKIIDTIKEKYPNLTKIDDGDNSTSYNYHIPGFKGDVGVIAAFSRTFCGSCNRIRLTAQGTLKTCLYDDGVLDIKSLIRQGADDKALKAAFLSAFNRRPKDGFEAEQNRQNQNPISESMSTIGG